MKSRCLLLAASLALCSVSACGAHTAANTRPVITDEALSRIKAGSSTKAQVKAALGTPWRTTNYGETYCGCPHADMQEVWDYRGVDSTGPYKLHLEFDDGGIVRIVARIPDVGAGGTVRVFTGTQDKKLASGHHHQGEH